MEYLKKCLHILEKKYSTKYMEYNPVAGTKALDMIIQVLRDINQFSLSGLFRVVSVDIV